MSPDLTKMRTFLCKKNYFFVELYRTNKQTHLQSSYFFLLFGFEKHNTIGSEVECCELLKRNDLLLVGTAAGDLHIFNADSLKIYTFSGHKASVKCCIETKDGYIVSGIFKVYFGGGGVLLVLSFNVRRIEKAVVREFCTPVKSVNFCTKFANFNFKQSVYVRKK